MLDVLEVSDVDVDALELRSVAKGLVTRYF
jgi:hypothetical protein